MSHIKEAFEQVCTRAKPAKQLFVSLYVNVPYYGGPEEGGWWGSDTKLVASQSFTNKRQAYNTRKNVSKLAERLSKEAKDAYGKNCLQQCEWLERRGLDDSFLPEPDGEEYYYVTVEDVEGADVSTGSRHYE